MADDGNWPALEIAIRLGLAVLVFAALAAWEWRSPRRVRLVARMIRWPSNLGIVVFDALLVRVLVPTALVGAALAGQDQGLFALIGMSPLVAGILGFLALDFAIYGQHVLFHKVPLLWRLHRVHHADLDLDVTTGLRFHPIEILISLGIKAAIVVALGIPVAAVIVFEVVLNLMSMFTHANAGVPAVLEPWLRAVFVTPQMHEVHHSVIRRDTDSNFGFNLAVWDRLCRTYREMPTSALGGEAVSIGLPVFRDPAELRFDRLLTQPFREPGHQTGAADAPPAVPDA